MAPRTDDYDGPFQCMGDPERHEYQVWLLAEFHERASSAQLADPADPVQYHQRGLSRLREIAGDLQDRQPVEIGRTPHNYVFNEQKLAFVVQLIDKLRDEPPSVGYLSSLWPRVTQAGDGWMWFQDRCYFKEGSAPAPNSVDLTIAVAELDDAFAAFQPRYGPAYLDLAIHEHMVDSDEEDDDDEPVIENLSGSSFAAPRSTLVINDNDVDASNTSFSCGGGDDYGGGFDLGEEVGAVDERSSDAGSPWQHVSALEERERDLGVGTSAQGAARAEAERAPAAVEASVGRGLGRGKEPGTNGDARWSKKRRRNDGVAVSARRVEKALDTEPLEALAFDQREGDDGVRLAHGRPARRRKRVAQRFTRTRTTFTKRHVVVKPFNEFDEEGLAEHFAEAVELVDPDKADTLPRQTYLLDAFWVHERNDPSTLVPLDRLLRVDGRQPLPDVVIVGLARPHDPVGDPRLAESKHREERARVVEAREVRLVARWDVRSVSFSVDGGPRLVSRLADYRLATPRVPAPRRQVDGKGKRRVAPLPRRRRPDSPPPLFDLLESYEPHVGVFRRLLNLYVFARTHAIRGSYVLSGDIGEDDDVESREASRVVDDIRRRIKASARDGGVVWQDQLPAFWRVPVEALVVPEDDLCDLSTDLLVFRALPDLPFVTPDIYKIVSPFFAPNTFRTENVDQVEHDMDLERRETLKLLNKYRDVVQEDLETQDEPAESVGRPVVKTSPMFVDDRSSTDKIQTWTRAVVNGVTYRAGDIVVMSSSMDTDGLATTRKKLSSEIDTAGNPASSGSESDGGQLEQEDRVGVDDISGQVWFALVEYFFQSRHEDELRVHLSWFSISRPIPSLSVYGSPRALFKLDRCDSPFATTISGRVDQPDDFRWLKPGDPLPRTGFYCGFTYNDDTGSFQDVSRLESTSFDKCRKYGLIDCASCESQAVYVDVTKPSVKNPQTRYIKAVRGGGGDNELFVLDGTSYHRDDTVYVAFLEHDIKPRNFALPRKTDPADAARTTWRLARLLDLEAPTADGHEYNYEPGDEIVKVKIEWIVRAQELKLSRTSDDAYLSAHEVLVTNETELVDAGSLRGRFTLGLVDEDDPHLAKTDDSGVVTGKARREPLGEGDLKVDDLLLPGGALYSGGGLLDIGLEQGCSLLRTRVAIEKHRPAIECLQSNFFNSPDGINKSVSDVNEAAYFGKDLYAPEPGSLSFLSGGSPCQGFSRLNRFKTLDDLRCAEPFVFLSSLAIFRPLHALYENVAAFETHALPYAKPGHERGSFFRLFLAVATALRYQLRWTIVNAAGYGVPQFRSRIIVQLAASGVRLPEVPSPSHAVKDARARRDHRLFDERDKKLEASTEDGAPHSPISLFEALDDLPPFDIKDCFDANKGYIARPFGVEGKPDKATEYGTIARTTFQQRCRTYLDEDGPAFSSGCTHHFCRSLSEPVARRVLGVKIGGNHENLKGKPFYPEPPPNVLSNPAKLAKWWRRCTPGMILSPLRATLSYDGSSQGERLHYSQLRPLSMRELLRVMGVPDAYELNFPSNIGDTAFDEQLRLIGNGVPVPLAAAFGRALEDALAPDVEAYFAERPLAGKGKGKGKGKSVGRAGSVWEKRWREIGSEALCARSEARAAREEGRAQVGHGWTSSSSSVSPSPMRSVSSDEVASLLLSSTAAVDRDETDRTSFESGAGGVLSPRRRVKAERHAIEVHDSDSSSDGELWRAQGGARKGKPEVIDLCDSDSDSDSD
ncbi:uncharacterized protein RHOBADRAFT_52321 [Rhodotorula graminis WP1]|uniref:DNA (cytosine-5-)-methyltransferase n=1 Tax=Rhodotorula graminis (strain WP1) TaxID=578459 RepID=A0A194SA69_RHOGW|nr:uncharacterized protein RHOBADRAFT_52321 [Rhodotorula graminis WP1]KPV76296.1 hypothetical protein RHOBADRAFT_52321 [Rhodotorula graminis WP1]